MVKDDFTKLSKTSLGIYRNLNITSNCKDESIGQVPRNKDIPLSEGDGFGEVCRRTNSGGLNIDTNASSSCFDRSGSVVKLLSNTDNVISNSCRLKESLVQRHVGIERRVVRVVC